MKMVSESLTDLIPYRKTIWICGCLKTTLSSALISTGVVLILNNFSKHPFFNDCYEIDFAVGLIAILFAIMVIGIIDKYHEEKRKEELEIIDNLIERKAEEIAVKKVLKNLQNFEEN